MMRRINDYCGDRIEILNKMSLAEYRLNPLPVDLLISTARVYNVNLSKKTKVIYVDYLMNEENLKGHSRVFATRYAEGVKQMIRMIASDLDGTLLRKDWSISEYTIKIIKKHRPTEYVG